MRIETVILELKARQYSVMESTFKTPPQNYEGFIKKLAAWIEISELLGIIEAARKKDEDDD